MPRAPLPLTTLEKLGAGLKRPEGVSVSRDGRVWASDRTGLDSGDPGPLQRLDPETGHVEVVCGEIAGRHLLASKLPGR